LAQQEAMRIAGPSAEREIMARHIARRLEIALILAAAMWLCRLAADWAPGPPVHPAAAAPIPLRPGEFRGPSIRQVGQALDGMPAADWVESYDGSS
jgi:hypothetical protein